MNNPIPTMEVKYFFKTEKLKDESGEEIGEGRKHPDVVAVFPKPTRDSVIETLASDSPAASLVMEAVEAIIFNAGRAQINDWRQDNPSGTFTPEMFDLNKLTLEAIALLPKKTRGGYSPSDEDYKAFSADYKDVMLHKVGYDPRKVGVHCKNLEKGLSRLRDEKKILEKMREFLDMWAAQTENMDEHSAVYEYLTERITKWLAREEKDMADAF